MNAYILSHNGLGDNLYMIGAVLYLLSDSAKSITGTTITVDAGSTA